MIFACWKITCQLAPWLLLGMFLSGMLHVFLPAGFIQRKFHGLSGIIKAVLLGVPLPLCSCGVVPAGIGLKNQGASDGAAVGFLISTPQTGIDSVLVASSFFGWPFAIFKMIAAAITGVVGGAVAEKLAEGQASDSLELVNTHAHHHGNSELPMWLEIWSHGLEIIRSIWGWLLIGILISAMIELYVPQTWIGAIGDIGLVPAMLVVLLISTPLYVCATASVPIAAALVTAGLPPAAALVFLMAGPATNLTTIGAIYGRFGWRTLLAYLSTIVGGSMLAAWFFDGLLTSSVVMGHAHHHDHQNWWSLLSGATLVAMVAWFVYSDLRRWISRLTQTVDRKSEIELEVDGMTCSGCVQKLESELQKNSAIHSVVVQLKPGRVRVSGGVSRTVLEQIIQKLGFRVTGP